MEREEVRRRSYHVLSEYEKARIMEMKGQGDSILKISVILKLNYTQVKHYIKKMSSPLTKYGKTGRPKKINAEIKKKIIEDTLNNRVLTLREHQQNIVQDFPLSTETIRKIRINGGLRYLETIKRPPLSPLHMNARVQFAQKMLDLYNQNELPHIIFTDESTIVKDLTYPKVWRYKGEVLDDAVSICEHHPISVMIWGGIGINFKTKLLWFNQKVDSKFYCDMLLENNINGQCLNAFQKFLFQQDGAKPHVSKYTKEKLAPLFPLLDGWPALSPDLSPIEMVWSLIKKKLKGRNFKTKEELFKACEEEWDNIPLETINRLVRSFIPRLMECVRIGGKSLNGHWTQVHRLHLEIESVQSFDKPNDWFQ